MTIGLWTEDSVPRETTVRMVPGSRFQVGIYTVERRPQSYGLTATERAVPRETAVLEQFGRFDSRVRAHGFVSRETSIFGNVGVQKSGYRQLVQNGTRARHHSNGADESFCFT